MRVLPRSLRQRVPLVVLVVFILVFAAFMRVLNVITVANYQNLERAQTARDVLTARTAFLSDEEWLASTVVDWGRWTDTYRFMAGENPTYPEENLDAVTITDLRLDFIALCTMDGNVVLAREIDPTTGAMSSDPSTFSASLEAAADTLKPGTADAVETGIALLGGRPASFAACQVTDNDRAATPNGVLVLGSFIGPGDQEHLRATTGLDVSLTVPPGRRLGDASDVEDVFISYPGADRVRGTVRILAVDGRPALDLAVTSDRTSTSRALELLSIVGWAMLGGIVLFGFAVGIALELTILRRLSRLHAYVSTAERSNHDAIGCVGGDDEITDLARALDSAEARARANEQQLRHEVDHDHLTGLVNRRRLEQDVAKALSEAERHGGPVSLLLIDLNDFKLVNDLSGHQCGDRALQWFADKVTATVREYSTVARIGGDEFAVLLPHAGREEAQAVRERIAEEISSEAYVCGERSYTITASIGLAVFPDDATNLDALTSAADNDMYARKRAREDA